MKIFVFGVGKYYKTRKERFREICRQDDFIGFIDNRADEIGFYKGVPVYRPEKAVAMEFDAIVLMSASFREMREQLLSLGVLAERIFYWEEYVALKTHGIIHLYTRNTSMTGKKKLLLITTDLNYNGGSIAIIYAAKCLSERGYAVCVAAPDGDTNLINEMVADGLNVITAPSLPYVGIEELFWINQFDIVMVNVFQMVQCACEISRIKPVLWWIHEPSAKNEIIYDDVRYRFEKYDDIRMMQWIKIYAVSEIARRNFEEYYPKRIDGTLSYGITDETEQLETHRGKYDERTVFAVIGGVSKRKAQTLFLEAITLIPDEERRKAEYWLIGPYSEKDSVVEMARGISEVKFTGVLTREQMWQTFPSIDVVVCASLEDPMPIVVTEGMMYSKACIVSDSVGQSQYIKNGENGFVCVTGDAESLAEKMRWCVKNRDKLEKMGKCARKTYEDLFTMEKFGVRLEEALLETEREWNKMQGKRE